MIQTMEVPHLYRVRGVDVDGAVRHSRVYQQSASAIRFAQLLDSHGFTVRLEQATDVTFETVIGGEL